MELLNVIFRDEHVNKNGKTIRRNAVRGIIMDRQNLLMIFSEKNGDYKFPGGGVKEGENFEQALIREVREESGAEIERITSGFGKVVEYALPKEKEYDVFEMTSYYYLCQIGQQFTEQQLDKYEEALGFMPRWICVDEALKCNKALLRVKPRGSPRWTLRETFILEQIKKELLDKDSS